MQRNTIGKKDRLSGALCCHSALLLPPAYFPSQRYQCNDAITQKLQSAENLPDGQRPPRRQCKEMVKTELTEATGFLGVLVNADCNKESLLGSEMIPCISRAGWKILSPLVTLIEIISLHIS